MTPDAPLQLTRESGFHPRTSALTRAFGEYRGFWVPHHFAKAGAIDEYWACRERAVIMDLSPLRKLEILGPDAEEFPARPLPARRAQARRRADLLHRALLRARRHGRRRHAVPARREQLPLGRRRRREHHVDQGAGGEAAAQNVLLKTASNEIHNVAVQGPEVARHPARDSVDRPRPPDARRARPVPLHDWPLRRLRRHARARLAHRLHRRARLRGLLPSEGRARRLGRDHGRRQAAWHFALRLRGARHGAHRGGPRLRRLRVLLATPIRSRPASASPCRRRRRRTTSARRRSSAAGSIRRRSSSASRSRATRSPPTATRSSSAGRRSASSPARTRSPTLKKTIALARLDVVHAELGTAVEIGKLDTKQKRLKATVVRFPFYDPEKTRVKA